MIRCSLSIAIIDKINIYVSNIKMYFIYFEVYLRYLVYPHFVFYFSQKYFNITKNVLYIKKLAICLLIIPNKSIVISYIVLINIPFLLYSVNINKLEVFFNNIINKII